MDRTVAARKLIADLVKAGQVEVRRVEVVGRDLVKLCEELKRPPTGAELGEWLDEHAQVSELCAPTNLLDELVDRYLAPPVEANVEAARNAELERELREAPATTGPYLVYADWLQERGDPVGELIALGVAAATGDEDATARFERHLKRHEAYLLGGIPQLDRVALRWRHGFVQAIEERADADALPARAWAQLLRLRVCEVVESITLRRPVAHELEVAIVEAAPPSLRTVVLEGCDGALPTTLLQLPLRSLSVQGATPYPIAIAALPAGLERLELRVPRPVAPAPPLELAVRELDVALTDAAAAFLTGARLPRVELLAIGLEAATTTRLPALLAGLDAPALHRLAVRGDALPLPTLAAIAELPLAARITELALVDVELGDAQVAALAAPLRSFTALAQLDLSYNELTRDGLAAARGLAPSVTSQRQHRRGNAMERRVRKFAGDRLQAAEAIADPKDWKRAFVDGDLRWARYRGEADYELFVSADLTRFGCSCPSSAQPCKHVAALALHAERTALPSAPSNRIEDRVGRRLADVLLASLERPDS